MPRARNGAVELEYQTFGDDQPRSIFGSRPSIGDVDADVITSLDEAPAAAKAGGGCCGGGGAAAK